MQRKYITNLYPGICDFLGISIYFDENMLSHSAAGKNVCIESVDENNKI